MTAALPKHVATDDEAIPEPGARLRGDGPDMRAVMPIEEMLADLREFEDDLVGYVIRWREHLTSVGGSVLLHYARDGEKGLTLGMPCDPQVRHRSRWAHFLFEDLDADDERRPVLMMILQRERLFWDERPIDAGATTRAMRDFIRTGGRIMVTPEGHVTEGGGAPRALTHGTPEERAEVTRAGRAYFDARHRLRTDRQIKRAARLFGRRTDNGWVVLEARA